MQRRCGLLCAVTHLVLVAQTEKNKLMKFKESEKKQEMEAAKAERKSKLAANTAL